MNQGRPKLRIAAIAAAAGICLISVACSNMRSSSGNPTAPSGPPQPGSTINYTAIGASDAVGYGSSQIWVSDCSTGMGYVFVTTRALRSQGFAVNLTLIAFPGETIGPDFQARQRQYSQNIPANEIDGSHSVPASTTLVTIFAGGNDIEAVMAALGGGAGGATQASQTAFIDAEIAAFAADYQTLLAGIRSRAANARIIVMNLPNFAGIPLHAADPLLNREAVQRLSVGMTREIDALTAQGVIVVDLMCDPRVYQASNFSADGFHPDDAGYAIMSGLIVQAANASSTPAPPASCGQMNLVQ